jgi:hypothetical protein
MANNSEVIIWKTKYEACVKDFETLKILAQKG